MSIWVTAAYPVIMAIAVRIAMRDVSVCRWYLSLFYCVGLELQLIY